MDAGSIKQAALCKNGINTEERRLRWLTKDKPEVVGHLQRLQDSRAARERKRRREIAESNERAFTLKRLKADLKQSKEELEKERKKLRNQEDVAVLRGALPKTYSPEHLGFDAKNFNMAKYRTARFEVLDKLSKLGQGLSDLQKNDFAWFKETWDQYHLEQEQAQWGLTFSTYVQHILNEISAGRTNAFSQMVFEQTRLLVADTPALRL